jgi:hypothetical protein
MWVSSEHPTHHTVGYELLQFGWWEQALFLALCEYQELSWTFWVVLSPVLCSLLTHMCWSELSWMLSVCGGGGADGTFPRYCLCVAFFSSVLWNVLAAVASRTLCSKSSTKETHQALSHSLLCAMPIESLQVVNHGCYRAYSVGLLAFVTWCSVLKMVASYVFVFVFNFTYGGKFGSCCFNLSKSRILRTVPFLLIVIWYNFFFL